MDFKAKFPHAFTIYEEQCKEYGDSLVGDSTIYVGGYGKDSHQMLGFLYNSVGYGAKRDNEEKILENTKSSVLSLLLDLPAGISVHSPLINAGKFGVPWEKTEAIIEDLLTNNNPNEITWTTWKLHEPILTSPL